MKTRWPPHEPSAIASSADADSIGSVQQVVGTMQLRNVQLWAPADSGKTAPMVCVAGAGDAFAE
jgi:hypothetical protein